MATTGNKTPDFIRHNYKVTHTVKSYTIYSIDEVTAGTMQLTDVLRIEKFNGKSNATNIDNYLRLRTTTNWSTSQMVTGLRPTNKEGLFYGDYTNKITGKKTLLLFTLSKDLQTLFIDVYRGFYPLNKGILQNIISTY